MLVSLAILIGTVVLFQVVPKGFIPSEDTGLINCSTETAEGTSFEAMVLHQKAVAAVIAADPNVENILSSAGGGGGGSANSGRVFIRLKPRSQRRLSADEVIRELQPKLSRIPGIRAYLINPPVISVGGRVSRSQYQFTLQSTDVDALYQGATDLLARLALAPELQDVTSDLQIKNPQVHVAIDRDRASALGISVYQIEETLANAYGSGQVSTILTPSDQYWVIMELMPRYQLDASALSMLTVRSSRGEQVPLGAVAKLSPSVGPLTMNHQGQIPAVTISFNLRQGVALGTGTAVVERTAREVLPSTITTGFFGTAQVFQSSQKGLLALLILAILVIYLVLGILYESFIHPLTILSGLPFAAFGALLTLMIFRTELTIYAYVGIIMLVGLVKKNAIMMIDFAIAAERNEGKSAREAILQACSIRFRPIMMTTFAALMGTLPIAIGFGAGAEARRPLGLAVVGGLAFSQLITLYITPVVYTYLDSFQRRLRNRKTTPTA
jgi:HAE1 family hydrophobic/amphiphilic exporter-1